MLNWSLKIPKWGDEKVNVSMFCFNRQKIMQIAMTALSVLFLRKSTTSSTSTVRGQIQVQVRVQYIAPYTKEVQDNYRSTEDHTVAWDDPSPPHNYHCCYCSTWDKMIPAWNWPHQTKTPLIGAVRKIIQDILINMIICRVNRFGNQFFKMFKLYPKLGLLVNLSAEKAKYIDITLILGH